jgi:chromate transporter
MTTLSSHPDFAELRVSARIGCLSFGGPAGQIALMHPRTGRGTRLDQRGAISPRAQFCHLLPGPEAQQLAIWIGWKLHGIRGGLAAGLLFVIPGALVILALDALWRGGASGVVCRAVSGHQGGGAGHCGAGGAAPCGRALGTRFRKGAALVSFLALFLFNAPFPLVVIGAG